SDDAEEVGGVEIAPLLLKDALADADCLGQIAALALGHCALQELGHVVWSGHFRTPWSQWFTSPDAGQRLCGGFAIRGAWAHQRLCFGPVVLDATRGTTGILKWPPGRIIAGFAGDADCPVDIPP